MKKVAALSIVIAVILLAVAVVAEAQQLKKVPRVGLLIGGPASSDLTRIEAFLQGLRELGYVEGNNIFIEYRYGDRQKRKKGLVELAADLVRLQVDVIVALDSSSARAAKKTTGTIPIVTRASDNPVEAGLITSLARPGGNITGLYSVTEQLTGKRLQLLKEVSPRLARVGVLWNPDFGAGLRYFKEAEFAATSLALQLKSLEVRVSEDLEGAFLTAIREQAQAVITLRTPLMRYEQERIVALANERGLPAIYGAREFVNVGGLMSYGPNTHDLYKRVAFYVDKILKGAKPGELPMERPTKFELVINLKTAKQIGLTIPPNVLVRADRVIK